MAIHGHLWQRERGSSIMEAKLQWFSALGAKKAKDGYLVHTFEQSWVVGYFWQGAGLFTLARKIHKNFRHFGNLWLPSSVNINDKGAYVCNCRIPKLIFLWIFLTSVIYLDSCFAQLCTTIDRFCVWQNSRTSSACLSIVYTGVLCIRVCCVDDQSTFCKGRSLWWIVWLAFELWGSWCIHSIG